ncbi:MAG: DUF1501 domain-containing protein [Myxococcales bacterium]|nr:DUF1501 domain-containing protein [Myxococcales bacterium]
MNRRSFLKLFAATGAASTASLPVLRALANPSGVEESFIVIHASGGWDVSLWADPRNARVGLVDPATDEVVETAGIRHWTPKPLGDGTSSFELVRRGALTLGPVMGNLTDRADRLTLVNGIAMDTVSHRDGAFYSATGRHLAGGRAVQTSVDSVLASELGAADLLPLVSVEFPSTFVSRTLDPRGMPLRMSRVTTAGDSVARSDAWTTAQDRDAVTAVLAEEAADLAASSYDPVPAERMKLQYEALRRLLADKGTGQLFDENKLRTVAQPRFFVDGAGQRVVRRFQDTMALNAAFAVEAIKKRVVRCVSFAVRGFDTHSADYADAPLKYQEFFDVIATLIDRLDAEGLSDRVHILVVSDFCRTPQINLRGGRDHHPNNSALIVSPRFKGGRAFGGTDAGQLLSTNYIQEATGARPIQPGDVIATLLAAMGIDPRAHLRDGVVMPEVLA